MWLVELELYYYKKPMYSPGMGHFLQTDPIGYADGLNWYNYVGGGPVNKRDPSGMAQFCHPDPSVTVGSVQSGSYRREFTPRIICQWFDDPTRGQITPSTPAIAPGRGTQSEPPKRFTCGQVSNLSKNNKKISSYLKEMPSMTDMFGNKHTIFVGFDSSGNAWITRIYTGFPDTMKNGPFADARRMMREVGAVPSFMIHTHPTYPNGGLSNGDISHVQSDNPTIVTVDPRYNVFCREPK